MSPTRRPSARATAAAKAKAKAAAPPAAPRPFPAHYLVPPHELLSEAECARLRQEFGAAWERLPKILSSDPGLKSDPKFLAAREAHENLVGRLVRIRRPSDTAGEAIAYRVVAASLGE
jgi:DNA-directed RNA polymerase subunit H (RpoH/RPB5)